MSIGLLMSPEALRRGGGVSAMADTKYAVAVSLKANSERHEGVGFLGRTVGSALSGVLLELFCRRGQKSGKKDKQQFTCLIFFEISATKSAFTTLYQ